MVFLVSESVSRKFGVYASTHVDIHLISTPFVVIISSPYTVISFSLAIFLRALKFGVQVHGLYSVGRLFVQLAYEHIT